MKTGFLGALVGLLICLLSTTTLAQPGMYYVLDSLDADLDGRPGFERALLVSKESPNPGGQASKEVWIMTRVGDSYQTVFRSPSFTDPISTDLELWQLQSPDTIMPGLHLRPGQDGRPELYLVFTSNSDHFSVFKFDGGSYRILGDSPLRSPEFATPYDP